MSVRGMSEIDIVLFGVLRKNVPAGCLKLRLANQVTVAELKEKICGVLRELIPDFNQSHLVIEAKVASETEILSEDVCIRGHCRLALLPPICRD